MDIKAELEKVYKEAIENGDFRLALDCLRELKELEFNDRYPPTLGKIGRKR